MIKNNSKCIVHIEDWQFQCCGIPFKVGDSIEWIIHKLDCDYKIISNSGAEYYYEHHSSDWQTLLKIKGIVDEIKAEYFSLKLFPNQTENHNYTYHRVYKTSLNVEYADGHDEDIDGLEFGSYIVTLRDFTILPAKQNEVTFS